MPALRRHCTSSSWSCRRFERCSCRRSSVVMRRDPVGCSTARSTARSVVTELVHPNARHRDCSGTACARHCVVNRQRRLHHHRASAGIASSSRDRAAPGAVGGNGPQLLPRYPRLHHAGRGDGSLAAVPSIRLGRSVPSRGFCRTAQVPSGRADSERRDHPRSRGRYEPKRVFSLTECARGRSVAPRRTRHDRLGRACRGNWAAWQASTATHSAWAFATASRNASACTSRICVPPTSARGPGTAGDSAPPREAAGQSAVPLPTEPHWVCPPPPPRRSRSARAWQGKEFTTARTGCRPRGCDAVPPARPAD